jgi:hypothetical protein
MISKRSKLLHHQHLTVRFFSLSQVNSQLLRILGIEEPEYLRKPGLPSWISLITDLVFLSYQSNLIEPCSVVQICNSRYNLDRMILVISF